MEKGRRNIPIQRHRHRPKPRTHTSPQRPTPNNIPRPFGPPHLLPNIPINTMNIHQCQRRENSHMRRAEHRLGMVSRERRAEENEQDAEDGGGEEGCQC